MKSSTSIIAYVGNGVVKGGLVLHEKGKQPVILSARKRNLKYYIDRDRSQIEELILAEFETLIKEIKLEDFPKLHNKKCSKPDTALIILSSPWYLSETNIIKIQEPIPFIITESLVNKATANIIKAYKGDKSDVAVLEQNFLSTIVNGYNVVDPIGKKTKELDISVFTSYAKAKSINRIENIVSDNFHLHNIHIHSQSLVSFSAINDLYPSVKDYNVIDITSALTEILIVKENTLGDTASFPLGRYFLMQSIAKSMGCNEDAAESLINSYSDDKLESEIQKKIATAINSAQTEWLNGFSAVLKKITTNGVLPKDFYLFVSRDVAVIFKQFIENEEYQQFALTEGNFNVKIIDVSSAFGFYKIDNEPGVIRDIDISIIAGALFNNKKLFA